MPRLGVHSPTFRPSSRAGRYLLANGVTIAYHGLPLSCEPGLRAELILVDNRNRTLLVVRASFTAGGLRFSSVPLLPGLACRVILDRFPVWSAYKKLAAKFWGLQISRREEEKLYHRKFSDSACTRRSFTSVFINSASMTGLSKRGTSAADGWTMTASA